MTSFAVPKTSNYISDNWVFNEWIVEKKCENKISLLFKVADLGLTPARYTLGGKRWVFVESEGNYYFNREEPQKVIISKDMGYKQLCLTVGAILLTIPSLFFAILKLGAIFSKTVRFSNPFHPDRPLLVNRIDVTIYANALRILDVAEKTDLTEVRNKYISIVRAFHERRNGTSGCIKAGFELLIQDAHRAYFTIMTHRNVKPEMATLEEIFLPAKSNRPPTEID